MIVVIRISGQIGLTSPVTETLYRMRLRRKYTAVLLRPSSPNEKLLKRMRNHIAFGDIDKETLTELIKSRGQPLNSTKTIDAEEIVSQLEKKSLKDLGLKPFFRLHPPRGGIESKKHAGVGKGVLGDNKKAINELIRRML